MNGSSLLVRSFAYVAPCMSSALAESREWAADILCLDLEDATPPDRKDYAREVLEEYLAAGRPRAAKVLVRINALSTNWGDMDLAFVRKLPVDGLLVPKVESAETVKQVRRAIGDKCIWCLIETPLGVLRAEEIALAGAAGLVIGGSDLSAGLGARQTNERLPLLHALSHVVLVARAYSLPAIDAYHRDYFDLEGIEASTRQSEEMGFDGKSVFSAETIAIANRVFRPTPADIERAQSALSGSGGYGGHIDHARTILERARLAALADMD